MHLDNARPRNSRKSNECLEEFSTRRVPYPAYSSDLAPNDFFHFGTLKIEMQNYDIHSKDDLISAIRSIFDEILKETLNSVYDFWKKKLKCVIKHEGEYFHY
jgi:hypothetical protein